MPIGAIIGAGIGLLGSSMQADAAGDAARTSAQAQLESARIAAEAQKFRPVGITTRFGTSNFTMSPEGYLQSAGYTLSPELKAIQDKLMTSAGQEGFSQQALQQAQGLFGLGQQFLPTSTTTQASPEAMAYANQLRGLSGQVMPTSYDPTAAAQKYVEQQQGLLQPGREKALSGIRQNLFNTGRAGLAVAQGGNLAASNPEMQAYYNAMAQQDAQLAAQGTQIGRQQLAEDIRLGTTLGAGALDTQQRAEALARERMLSDLKTGTGLFGTGISLATGGYDPLKTQIGLSSTLESLGQNPLDLGASLGGRVTAANTNAANTLLSGSTNAARTMQQANQYSPVGAALTGLAGNQQFTSGVANWLSGLNQPSGTTLSGNNPAVFDYAYGGGGWY